MSRKIDHRKLQESPARSDRDSDQPNDMIERYGKQTILPEIGQAGQQRLAAATVLCVGAGGLGCAALPYLAGAGVGRIIIIDADRVDLSNLQRQVLFTETDVGQPKADVAARRLTAINGSIEVEGIQNRLDLHNVESLYRRADVIIDGTDNYPTKYLAADASVKFGVPLVYGSATGMEAMVTVFEPGRGPCLRCLFREAPSGWVPNCAEAGVLGPLVGAAGAIQAVEAIKLIVGGAVSGALSRLCGRLWLIDARDLSSRQLAFGRSSDCPTCSKSPEQIELASSGVALTELGRAEAEAMDDAIWVDVREPDEFEAGHIPGATNLPLSRLQTGTFKPPEAKRVIVYCASGMRCRPAAAILRRAGIDTIYVLRGGFSG